MKPRGYVVLGVCLVVVASLLLSGASNRMNSYSAEPQDVHSVNEAFLHALAFAEQHYSLPRLTQQVWTADVDNHPDLSYATHHVFVNKPETVGELQALFAFDPDHSSFVTNQLTVIVHAPDDPHLSHKVTLFDGEMHLVWSARIDVDGHVTEYMHYE
jgi:hypothetical protein